MTQRERYLAIGVGAMAVLIGGYFAMNAGFGLYEAKNNALEAKEREVALAKADLAMAEVKQKKLKAIGSRALPGEIHLASNTYKEWLRTTLLDGYFDVENITPSQNFIEGGKGKEYGKLKFDVHARARLDDLTTWLHHFYSVDCLHRMKGIKLTPIQDSRMLNIVMEIEVISLTKVSKDQSKPFVLRPVKGQTEEKLKAELAKDREKLLAAIAGRNVFGPPNIEPSIQPIGKIPATTGKEVEVFVKGKDKLDGTNETDDRAMLLYQVVETDFPGYTFDPLKGALRWTPKKAGEYKATVEVADDGVPRKSAKHTFTIVVKDPEKPAPQPVVRQTPSSLDPAKFAFVTAIVQEEGVGQVWINERSSGKSKKLKIGDPVQIGSVTGKVSKIDSTGIEVETSDAKFFTKIGQALGAAAMQAGGS